MITYLLSHLIENISSIIVSKQMFANLEKQQGDKLQTSMHSARLLFSRAHCPKQTFLKL